MPFVTDVVEVEILPSGLYRLTRDLIYNGKSDTFTVPAGYISDLASVPRYLSALVPIAGRSDRAAIIHDWLCTDLDRNYRDEQRNAAERVAPYANAVDTDGIFRRILRELGTPLVLRWLYWCGVRWGALVNPARRAGWLSTALPVLGISLVALPFVLPVAVVTLAALAVGTVAQGIAGVLGRTRKAAT